MTNASTISARSLEKLRMRELPVADDRTTERSDFTALRIGLFFSLHVGLALLVMKLPFLTAVQAGVTLVFGLWWTGLGRHSERVVIICAYITGSEVMWRMTDAWVFWESGKYLMTAFCLLGLFRMQHKNFNKLAILYFALLLPSVVLTLMSSEPSLVRHHLSANLSGPLALAAGVCFFSNVRLSRQSLQNVFTGLTGPAITIATLALLHFSQLDEVRFTQSNFDTSGGFGPNQVSAILGLGAFFCVAFILFSKQKMISVILMLIVASFLSFQSALTFSRGGLYSAGLALAVGFLFLLGSRKRRFRAMILVVVAVILASLFVIPQIQAITGGHFSKRFESLDPTKRDLLMASDLKLWVKHPLLGIGPGMVSTSRTGIQGMAHTEFSRLLAEHGSLGGLALILLLTAGFRRFARSSDPVSRAIVASMLVWSLSYMLHSATRLAAPSFIFALGCIGLQPLQNRAYRLFLYGTKLWITNGKQAKSIDLKVLPVSARLGRHASRT